MLRVVSYKKKPLEIYASGVRMALVKNKRTVHPLVTCKDFISDIFWLEHQRKIDNIKDINIYEFKYKRNDNFLEDDFHELYLTEYPEGKGEAIQNLLNEVEIKMNFSYSLVKEIKKGYLITFDKSWREYPYLLSLFLLLVRIGGTYNNQDLFEYFDEYAAGKIPPIHHLNVHDSRYLKTIKPLLKKLLIDQEILVDSWDSHCVKKHHDHKGVVSFCELNDLF